MSFQVGDELPALERKIDLVNMVAYAGATWDWYKLHYDPEEVAKSGLPGPVVDGQVFGAMLVEQIQDWLGPQAFPQEVDFTFRNLVFAGETIRCEGTITEVGSGYLRLEQKVVVVDEAGQVLRTAAAPAHAKVLLGSADGPGAK